METRTNTTGISLALCAFASAAAVSQSVGYFAEPSQASALAHALLAALAGALAAPLPDLRGPAVRWLTPLAGLALIPLGAPWMAIVGPIAWGLLAWCPSDDARLRRVRSGLGTAGALLLFGHLAVPFWIRLELAAPELTAVATLGAWLLDLLGHEAVAEGAVIHLSASAGGTSLLVDPLKLGGLFAALGTTFFVALDGRRRWRSTLATAAGTTAIVLSYSLVRLLILANLPQLLHTTEILLDPTIVYASFLPGVILLGLFAARSTRGPTASERPEPVRWRSVPAAAGLLAAAIGTLLLSTALGYHDVGEPRPGRVVMDESHGRWEASDVPFDTESWGRGSTYNYAEFSDLLGRHFEYDVNRDGPITPELLEDTQVVVLKTPSSPYTVAELEALHEFVTAGGGIWLIGDHTNLYGMSDCLNPIAKWAGMEFRNDATYDAATGDTTYNTGDFHYHPSAIASDELGFQTSCSIAVTGPGVEPVLVGWRLTGEYADYGHPNFFGNLRTELVDRTGLMLQAAIGSVGAGRVAAFSDSTIFSNFSIFDPGVSEYALRTVQALRHPERLPKGWRELAFVAGLVLCAFALRRAASCSSGALPLVATAFAVAFLGTGQLVDTTETDALVPPEPTAPYRDVAFLEGPSSFVRTAFVEEANGGQQDEHAGHAHARSAEPLLRSSLSTFITWTLRVDDARPRLESSVEEAVENGAEMIVLYDPVERPTHADQVYLRDFVRHGGVFLVLDDLVNARSSTANAWLLPFELEIEVAREDRGIFQPRPAAQMGYAQTVGALSAPELVLGALQLREPVPDVRTGTTYTASKLVVRGGSAVILDESGDAISSTTQLGRGRAGVFTRSSALTNESLGGRFDLAPNAQGLERHLSSVSILELFLDYQLLQKEVRP